MARCCAMTFSTFVRALSRSSSEMVRSVARTLWARVVTSFFFAKFRQNVARFRLYRHRFLQENTRFAAFFKIYQIIKLNFLKFGKILQTSPFRDRVAELRGPTEGLEGKAVNV